ncbi:unnamed protein product [Urochloa humidicola]
MRIEDDLAYRKMEEGAYVVPPSQKQPADMDTNNATWNFVSIAFRCISTVLGIGMLACFLVMGKLEDPCKVLGLCLLGITRPSMQENGCSSFARNRTTGLQIYADT